ncbi:uncharacterized protein LY89DRAFT_785758 [Mollisia scopiformis]|uniref:BZIP domain-containing protein n=1 Tax=Mollisia scopiformis TaxID=149040 RepID=A0A194WWN5_MOLSC|nr:uncharacterized protein LY89DRAFT_785758 [Mollisia scopiformis]KUJ12383.1 hypothetical protein LY89DRAFT_785758 [Mollisia scopiformis]
MHLGYNVEPESFSQYECGGEQVLSPVDLDLYQEIQQPTMINWETPVKHMMFDECWLWPDTPVSVSSCDSSSPRDNQQPMAIWEESARAATISRHGRDLHQDPILFPWEDLLLDFETTSSSRRPGGRQSERRKQQNRASQRAFRERQRTHVQDLEDRLADLTKRHRELERAHQHLNQKYQSLAKRFESNEEVVDSEVSL